MKNKLGWLAGALFAVGIGAGIAGAGQKAPTADRDAPKKAQRGEACKVDADCDQSDTALVCEKNKCQPDRNAAPRRPPPVT